MTHRAFSLYCEKDGTRLEPLYMGRYDPWTGKKVEEEKTVRVICRKCGAEYYNAGVCPPEVWDTLPKEFRVD